MQSHRNTSGRQRLKCYNLQSRAQEMEQRVKPGTDVETPKRGFQKVQRTLQGGNNANQKWQRGRGATWGHNRAFPPNHDALGSGEREGGCCSEMQLLVLHRYPPFQASVKPQTLHVFPTSLPPSAPSSVSACSVMSNSLPPHGL